MTWGTPDDTTVDACTHEYGQTGTEDLAPEARKKIQGTEKKIKVEVKTSSRHNPGKSKSGFVYARRLFL